MNSLVFVHGFMGGSDQWQDQAALAKGDVHSDKVRELICVDLPGFGKNAHLEPINSICGYADWVLLELTKHGVQRFDLLGHSMGGMIVQEMARAAPDRVKNLILYATGATGVLPGRFESIETSMQRAQTDGPEATARRISATWFLNKEAASGYKACAAVAENSTTSAIQAGLEAMKDWHGADKLPDIAANTLVVWGDCDRTYKWPQVEELWMKIPSCSQLVIVPNCAHAVHMEKPALFNCVIDGFLRIDE